LFSGLYLQGHRFSSSRASLLASNRQYRNFCFRNLVVGHLQFASQLLDGTVEFGDMIVEFNDMNQAIAQVCFC
jgi:hypothetical protein